MPSIPTGDRPGRLTPTEKSWVLYDVANSAFVLIVTTTLMPIFYKEIAARGVDTAVSTAHWGFANSASSLLVALAAPFLGALADYENSKKKLLTVFLLLGVVFTLLLAAVGPGDALVGLLIYIAARVGFAGANIFYDAFIVDVTSSRRMDWVSACGYGFGYIGSIIPFLGVLGLVFWEMHASGVNSLPEFSTRIGFTIVALWWFAFAVPLLKNVRQVHFVAPAPQPFQKALRRLAGTLRDIRRHRQAFLFLAAYFFYIDGVGTIIIMATAYGRDIGLGVPLLLLAVLLIQVFAFPFALLYGKLAWRFSAKTMLFTGIGVYTLVTLISYLLPSIPGQALKVYLFWWLAFLVASSQGGIQALSRSYFGRLIPHDRAAEFFGFYNIVGKFAAILGPFLIGIFSRLTGHSRYGILSLLALFIIGGVLLYKTDDPGRNGSPPETGL